jgi:tetratricopeptide (TPR) repeat protein
MANPLESKDLKTGETGSIIQESLDKFAQALEMETSKLREQAEQDSNQIIAGAREEADRIIAQARQKAEAESNNLIAKTKEETNQILRKASAEARQESARIISETREKTSRIIKEVFEPGVAQAKDELALATSEVRSRLESEKSRLLEVIKNIEQIIGETETNIKAGSEHLTSVVSETERKLEAINEVPDRETVVDSRQVNTEAIEERQEIEKALGEEVKVKVEESPETEDSEDAKVDAITRVHEGTVPPSSERKEDAKEAQEAEKRARKAAEDAKLDAKIWMHKGEVLLESGKNEEAVEAFVKVTELDPKNAIAWRKKGAALGLLKRHEEALEADVKAIQLDPHDIIAWHNKAAALTNLGRKEEAKEAQEAEKRARKEAERRQAI